MMRFEFADGTSIPVISINGGPQLVHGSMRDTIHIEIDPESINFNSLKALFGEPSNLETIYSVCVADDSSSNPVRSEIGTGYTILVSISDETRKVNPSTPGILQPATYEEVYIVTIAQETYEEHQLKALQNS